MSKLKKNNFLFIILISVVTLIVLVVGAVSLYEDNSSVFDGDGYILETSTKTNKKYYFSANTKYKENVDRDISFKDKESNTVAVSPASFVHYTNGNVAFLQKGALVNLADITSPMVSYYNITDDNIIVKDNDVYTVTSNDKKININSFIGRISDEKYLIAGKDLSIKVPKEEERVSGDYFELLFIEEGIVKIDNKDNSFQVTAQDSYVYVGDNITISLGDGKIYHDSDAKMLLSQITIDNDENINLDVYDKDGVGGSGGDGSGGSGDGEGSGEGDGEGDGTGEDSEDESALGEIEGSGGEGAGGAGGSGGEGAGGAGGSGGDGTGEGTGDGKGDGKGDGSGSGGGGAGGAVDSTLSLKIELIEAKVSATSIDLKMQLNNADMAKGNVVATLTDVKNGGTPIKSDIPLSNGTFTLSFDALVPETDHTLSIAEVSVGGETQYFQKNFRTKELGIALEKVYATDKSLAYSVVFDEDTDVTKVKVGINYDKAEPVVKEVKKSDVGNLIVFNKLKSDTQYHVSIDEVTINGGGYPKKYEIYKDDKTLKKEPSIKEIKVETDEKAGKFTIKMNGIDDPDKSIISYTYKIYKVEELTADNVVDDTEPEFVDSIVKYDSDPLVVSLSDENGKLESGVNYKCRVFAQYHDNEMEREVASDDYSNHFLVRTRPSIDYKLIKSYINKADFSIKLIDPNGTVPRNNNFIIRVYKEGEEENNENDIEFNKFNSDLSYNVVVGEKENALGEKVGNLASNTSYIIKVYGDYYEDVNGDGILDLVNGQIGDSFEFDTAKSDNIYFQPLGDNKSNNTDIVNFNARLSVPEGSETVNLVTNVTFKLYKGRSNDLENLIGTYKITDKNTIKSLFNNYNFTNSLFTDATSNKVGLINNLNKLIAVTGNEDKSLTKAYTVEVTDVFIPGDGNQVVEDSIYTFNLTSSYYLDARIASNKGPYVTYKPIYKKDLTEEEHEELLKEVNNLDLLNDDTVVGIKLENSLAYNHVVDSFDYEKVVVDYVICNDTTKDCDAIINKIVELDNQVTKTEEERDEIEKALENEKKKVKIVSVPMDNWYRTATQTIWLDSSELEDGKGGHFTRGYNYKVGYNLNFTTKDATNPTYTNEALYVNTLKTIPRQEPFYTQYISFSNSKGITYRYSFSDVDKAIADKNFYYLVDGSEEYQPINNSLVVDGEEHEVIVPLTSNNEYSLAYATKNFVNKLDYKAISNHNFETEFNYDKKVAYTIDKKLKNNVLRLKLESNVATDRAQVYKVVIKAKDSSKNISDYTRYFIASQLATMSVPTGEVDGEGNPIEVRYKYIDIDYANISRFIGVDMSVDVYSYYNSGLVGVDQNFEDGMVLYNHTDKKYLNIYNGGSDVTTSEVREESYNMGIYYLKEDYTYGNSNIYIYNKLLLLEKNGKNNTIVYNPLIGASYYSNEVSNLGSNVGINFSFSVNSETVSQKSNARGILLINPNDEKKYSNYTPIVLKEANLVTDDKSYKFDSIIPSIEVISNTGNTINSVHIEINPTGIYSNKQFKKGGQTYNKVEVDVFEDEACEKKINTLYSDIHIKEDGVTGYSATIDDIDYTNLKPDTSYYFKVFAYIDNERVQLYDSGTKTAYVTKTYKAATLSAKSIYQSFKFYVEPIDYEDDGSSKKRLTWRIGLSNTLNYKLRFELFEPDSANDTVDENGEVVKAYKPVKFNGNNDMTQCNLNTNGTSTNNYVTNNGCYISIAKEDINTINNKEKTYEFSGDDFVFGGNYYKIVIYAVPYTNGNYDEANKLVIYQNDSLTTSQPSTSNNFSAINIPTLGLDQPKVNMGELSAGYKCKNWEYNSQDKNMVCLDSDQYYFISYTSSVTDKYKVIRNGKYTVSLLNEKLEKINSCRYFINYDNNSDNNEFKTINEGGCSVSLNVDDINQNIRFADLDSNTMYYIEVDYDAFRNNVGFSDNQKTQVIPYTDFTYTPIAKDITLGNINAEHVTTNSVTLIYNGSTNLPENITRVEYTIRVKAGNAGFVSGEYIIGKDKKFEFMADNTPTLKIDIKDSSFSFREGNTYIISTSYYYMTEVIEDGKKVLKEIQLVDQYTGNGTYTTIKNL